MTQSAFIVIDVQNDYFPDGAMALNEVESTAEKGQSALAHARNVGMPIIIVQHIALSPKATFFRPDTPGAEIRPGFQPLPGEQHLIKHYPSAFRETNLQERLESLGTKDLVVCGMMTHMCIDSTVRAAKDLGYSITLLGDATATRDLQYSECHVPASSVQAAILAALNGTFARVTTVQDWINGS